MVPGTGGDNIKRCIALIILAVVCTGNGAFGQNSAGGVEQSVVAVLDLSYSMRLTESSGATRLEILKGGLRSIFERPVAGVEWAIIGFDDTDSIQLYQPFTTDHGALLGVLREVGSGRLSPVGDALSRAAAYLRGNARSVDGKVLLVSDGISTGGVGFGFRLSEEYAKRRIPLFILGFPHESNPSLRESLGLIASHTGGSYYTFDAVGDLRRELLQPWSLVHGLSNGSALAASASGAPNGGGRLYLVPLILCVPLFGLTVMLHRRAVEKKRKFERRAERPPRVFLCLDIVDSAGAGKSIRTSESPLVVGTKRGCHVVLEKVRRKVQFTYRWDAENAEFESNEPFLLNGVAVKSKRLKEGDRLKCEGYRLIFRRLEVEEIRPTPLKDPSLYPLAAGVFALFLFVLLLSIEKLQSPAAMSGAGVKVEAREAEEAPDAGLGAAAAAPAAEKPRITAAGAKVVQPRPVEEPPRLRPEVVQKRERAYSAPLGRLPEGPLQRREVAVVAPGETVPFEKVDILFIHAHPDDESLDFGGLMARAAAAGKRTAVVLFTDGEAGLDQYPDRPADGRYAAEELTGVRLAEVRVQEAAAALSLLGCPLYVRLGFENHPYNSSLDVMGVDAVLEEWGGRERVAARVRELIRGFRPDVVVSSDFNPDAFEHFEHKAVGLVTREVVAETAKEGSPKAHIVSVDPFQTLYDDLLHVDLMKQSLSADFTYREIQIEALKEHRTQGDASLIGVELLPNFVSERYLPIFWSDAPELTDYLAFFSPDPR